MGLHIHTLGGIPIESDRRYFVYVLDYGWKEPITETLVENFTNMARKAADSQSVVVAGIDPVHFANEVFSWHGINGEDGEKVLPAVMVTSLHPEYFRQNGRGPDGEESMDAKMLLIPLRDACATTDDVITMIRSIFTDIREQKNLLSFEIAKVIKKEEEPNRAMDALILEPNFMGVGVRIPQAIKLLLGKGD